MLCGQVHTMLPHCCSLFYSKRSLTPGSIPTLNGMAQTSTFPSSLSALSDYRVKMRNATPTYGSFWETFPFQHVFVISQPFPRLAIVSSLCCWACILHKGLAQKLLCALCWHTPNSSFLPLTFFRATFGKPHCISLSNRLTTHVRKIGGSAGVTHLSPHLYFKLPNSKHTHTHVRAHTSIQSFDGYKELGVVLFFLNWIRPCLGLWYRVCSLPGDLHFWWRPTSPPLYLSLLTDPDNTTHLL